MNIWKNTKTLDKYVPNLVNICDPAVAEVAVIGSKSVNLDNLPKLRGLFKCGIGRDNVPEKECAKRGIKVCFPSKKSKKYIFEETANFTVSLIFRKLYANLGSLENWEKQPRIILGNKKVLLIGLGNIGSRVSAKISSFVEVLTYDIITNQVGDLRELMRAADVVSLHIPLIDATRDLINKEKLGWMKDGAALVNTARGSIVNEAALLTEIESGRLSAAFDVYWNEPYHGKLRNFHPNRFLMSPHVASNCVDFLESMSEDLNIFIEQFN
jgi:phosphoglycerate dehydrogenase-like enzyme